MNIHCFTFGPVAVNTYILYKGNEAVIVDCGVSNDYERERLISFLNNNNLTLVALLNTHMHFDHVMGNVWAVNTFKDIKCYAPHKDIDGLPPVSKQIERFMIVEPEKIDLPKDNYIDIKEGDKICLADEEISVIDVPGHSPGHVAFLTKDKSVIAGDVLFYESIGRTDLWGGSLHTLIKSIKEKLFVLPDDTIVYSGHGEKTTIGHEKRNNQFIY